MFNIFNKNKENKNNNDLRYNKNIEFIYNMFNDLIDNQFKCNRNDLVRNGSVFYFNGQNGTKFDWYTNGHTSTLASIYPDGTEAVKIHIYNNGEINVYYYKKGSNQPDGTLSTKISVETAKIIATLLFTISDRKGLFDKELSKLELSYELTQDDIDKFDDENFIG